MAGQLVTCPGCDNIVHPDGGGGCPDCGKRDISIVLTAAELRARRDARKRAGRVRRRSMELERAAAESEAA